SQRMPFENAKSNFFRAARHGLDAQFNWIDGQSYPAAALVLEHLLPLARQGLQDAKVDNADIDKYLSIIETRTESRQTGAAWILRSMAAMRDSGSKDMQQKALAAAMLKQQQKGRPIHKWPLNATAVPVEWAQSYRTIGQFMSTDLFTVQPDDL